MKEANKIKDSIIQTLCTDPNIKIKITKELKGFFFLSTDIAVYEDTFGIKNYRIAIIPHYKKL